MKLERLRVRGLRSYVREVEIDLARLGEEGLFAIFGPTGSGKSTILDGIFLALFGRCPRGEAGDCVSAGAFELGVRLEIDAGWDDLPRLLAIERRFRWSKKRDADAGANGPDLRGAPRHLPLRIEERNEGIWSPVDTGGRKPEDYLREQIVRVSMSDFQQAVVLPQGQFDALLRARPAERRTLVASLFRTEHLGQPLFDALRAREVEVRDELARLVEAEREVLVTPDDVEAARARLEIARLEARRASDARASAESSALDLHMAWQRCAARDAAIDALAAVESVFAERAADRLRLELGRRAAGAEAALLELDQSEIAAAVAEVRATSTEHAARVAEADRRAVTAARIAATAARTKLLPSVFDHLRRSDQILDQDRAGAALAAELDALERGEAESRAREDDARDAEIRLALEARDASARCDEARSRRARAESAALAATARAGFASLDALRAARLDPAALALLAADLDRLATAREHLGAVVAERRRDSVIEVTRAEVDLAERARDAARRDAVDAADRGAQAASRCDELARRTVRTLELRARAALLEPRAHRLAQVRQVVAANQLAELAAERHLEAVTRGAADLLRSLSADRYALVRTPDGAFAVADSALGGLIRPPCTLSGGETFLVSLALALALSERIQLAGRTRFDFFFLDEGFGALDAVTLDTAVSALERLRGPHRVIGMISHLAAIEERMPRKLRVQPGRPGSDATVLHEVGERPREQPRSGALLHRKPKHIPRDPPEP